MKDYIIEFDHLIVKCDLVVQEEDTIARYLRGLRLEVGNMVGNERSRVWVPNRETVNESQVRNG